MRRKNQDSSSVLNLLYLIDTFTLLPSTHLGRTLLSILPLLPTLWYPLRRNKFYLDSSSISVDFSVPPNNLATEAKMPTSFPREIKVKDVKFFNGTPSDLDSFDNSVKNMMLQQNHPLYYGRTVEGDPDGEYEYVWAGSARAKSNYVIGKRLCAALSGKFKDEVQKWWEDRDNGPNGKVAFPNCWRKHADMDEPVEGCVPDTIVEVSLYDLLLAQFSPETDSRAAEIELGKFKWEPFKKVAGKPPLSFISYRSHVERLLRRANKTSAFEKVRCIRNTLPKDFKEKTDMTYNEKAVWEKIEVIFVTAEVDTLDQAVTK